MRIRPPFLRFIAGGALVAGLGGLGCVSATAPDAAAGATREARAAATRTALLAADVGLLAGPTWRLVSFRGSSAGLPRAREEGAPTLQFLENNRALGYGGVNTCQGPYSAQSEKLILGPFAVTKRVGPGDLLRIEHEFFQALHRVTVWRLAGAELRLLAGDIELLRFAAD
jgi:heat shock protein HslJ